MIRFLIVLLAAFCLGFPCAARAQYGTEWSPYQFGTSIAGNEVAHTSPGSADDEFGIRYWYSWAELSYQVSKPQISSLDYVVNNSQTGEMFFYLTSRNAKYLFKGVIGLGGDQNGNVDDSDYNIDGSKGSDTNSSISDGRLFYAYADLGYKLNFLSTASARTSLLGGIEYLQDVMTAHGVTCNQVGTGSFAGTCTSGAGEVEVGPGVKSLQNEGEWTAFRLGLENNYHPTRRISWHNEVAFIPAAYFRNNDLHYLRTDLGSGQPNIVDNGNYSYGVQLETNLEYNFTPSWSVDGGFRYWQFWVPQSTTKVGNPQIATENSYNWDYDRMGVFVGMGYHF